MLGSKIVTFGPNTDAVGAARAIEPPALPPRRIATQTSRAAEIVNRAFMGASLADDERILPALWAALTSRPTCRYMRDGHLARVDARRRERGAYRHRRND